jgi:hypothetical protein
MTPLQAVTHTLTDLKDCLSQINNTLYASPMTIYSGSTLGQHTRHVIEFYQCLVEQTPHGLINYDRRRRNYCIESSTETAIDVIDNILAELHKGGFREYLILESEYDIHSGYCSQVPTNFERELIYNLEHTIHHMALIKIGLIVAAPEVSLPEHFGVAISTIRHKSQANQVEA